MVNAIHESISCQCLPGPRRDHRLLLGAQGVGVGRGLRAPFGPAPTASGNLSDGHITTKDLTATRVRQRGTGSIRNRARKQRVIYKFSISSHHEISITAVKRNGEARCTIMKLLVRCYIFKWGGGETPPRYRTARKRCYHVVKHRDTRLPAHQVLTDLSR